MRNRTCAVAALLLAVGAAGCIDVAENIQVDPAGTARYEVDFAIPEMFFGFMAAAGDSGDGPGAKFFGKPPEGRMADSMRTRDFVDGDMHHFAMERDLRSIEQLPALAVADTAGSELGGKVLPGYAVERLDAHRLRLTRAMNPDSTDKAKIMGRLDDGSTEDVSSAVSDEAMGRMFAGRTYTLRLHAARIESSNGTIAADGKSVEWRMPITALISGDTLKSLEAVIDTRGGPLRP
jgi:hypothetical protein